MGLEFVDPAVLVGAGGGSGILGFIAGHFRTRNSRISRLEKEVQECRKRDARVVVIEAGFRMIVGEMVRENPGSVALRMCADLLARKMGPEAPDPSDFQSLLRQLDDLDTGRPRRDGPDADASH